MVATDPAINQGRVWWERIIYGIDMVAYCLLGIAGVWAYLFPTDYVLRLLNDWTWTRWGWGVLLMFGFVAFVGRLIRVWAVEYAANVFAGWGGFAYFVLLLPNIPTKGTVVLSVMIACATLAVARRYAELKILTYEPGLNTFRKKLDAAMRRRTKNVVPRDRD